MEGDPIEQLRSHGIRPTPQRITVAACVLDTDTHPTADQVLAAVRRRSPTVSRATVYNTLHLFVARGLLRTQVLQGGTITFDPNVRAHHHFIDERTGRVYDIPWNAIRVSGQQSLEGFDVRDFHVVLRGRRRGR